MNMPLPVRIALRYSRSGGGFLSFVTSIAATGLGLGVAVLVVVLSVMNGFERELRERILGVLPHLVVAAADGAFDDWEESARRIAVDPRVAGVAPLDRGPALAVARSEVIGVQINGVIPAAESAVSILPERLVSGSLAALEPGSFVVLVGAGLAERLALAPGDTLTLVMPDARVTAAGVFPRQKRVRVGGVFRIDADLDDSGVYLHLDDARRLLRIPGAAAELRVRLHDLFQARSLLVDLMGEDLGEPVRGYDWSRTHGNLYAAIGLQKRIMFVLLSLLVAVAAFNVVSMLSMVVASKRGDIAMLRTLGMRPRSLFAVFVGQGSVIAAMGIVGGLFVGVAVSLLLPRLVEALQAAIGRDLLAEYFVRYLPIRIEPGDLLGVTLVALTMALLVTLLPARRALTISPAEELRYE